jgi:hypothetical protein
MAGSLMWRNMSGHVALHVVAVGCGIAKLRLKFVGALSALIYIFVSILKEVRRTNKWHV